MTEWPRDARSCVLPTSWVEDSVPRSQVGPLGCMILKTPLEAKVCHQVIGPGVPEQGHMTR